MNLELHRRALTRFCLGYLDDPDDAADAVQELFQKSLALRVAPRDERAWLLRAARNHCLNLLRSKRRRRDDAPLTTGRDVPAAWTGPITALLNRERAEGVALRLASLGDDQRELLRLRYWDELSRGEIANLLGLSESTVKSRLFEAIEKLRGSASG